MKTRPRSASLLGAGEDVLDDLLAGPVGRVGLAGEDDLDGPLGVADEPGQAIHVGEHHPGPLVGREAAGKADRQGVRIEHRVELVEDGRRLSVPGELGPQAAPGEVGQLALLAEVRRPELGVGNAIHPLPPSAGRGRRVQLIEIRVEVAGQQLAHRRSHPGRGVDAVRDAEDRRRDDVAPGPVRGLGVELADRVGARRQAKAEGRHVELGGIAVRPEADVQDPVEGDATGVRASVALEQRAGDATDEPGVEAFVAGRDRRVDREDAVAPDPGEGLVERRPRRPRTRGPARPAGTPSDPR